MRHFKLIGPLDTVEFDIKGDEVIEWQIIKKSEQFFTEFEEHTPCFRKNIKTYSNIKRR